MINEGDDEQDRGDNGNAVVLIVCLAVYMVSVFCL